MSNHTTPSRKKRAPWALIASVALAAGLTAGCTPTSEKTTQGETEVTGTSSASVFSKDDVTPLVDGVVKKTPKDLPTARLAEGLIPPTNRWFSGLVFGDTSLPVFPLPLSFGATDNGFAFGLPNVATTEKTITGGYTPNIEVGVPGAKQSIVSAYDEASVTLQPQNSDGAALGSVRIAEGSPYVTFTADQAAIDLSVNLPATQEGDYFVVQAGEAKYGLVLDDGELDGTTVKLKEGGTATWFAVPTEGDAATLAELAQNKLEKTSLSYSVDGKQASTTLTYDAGGDTAFVAMPHQQAGLSGASCDLGTYPSIFGTLKLCSGTELTWSSPTYPANAGLDLSDISADEKAELAAQVAKDVDATKPYPADTYFGGKALYRDSQLYMIATQVGADAAAEKVKERLTTALEQWTEPKGCETRDGFCFVYDEKNRGLVGLTPSFGSEEYNDHHFHYGYFLYAAGVMGADDPALMKKMQPVMDLLAADIASSGDNGLFPNRRTFDGYASHSWASGTSPFADGNNQESSSEAVNAWAGLALWAKASDNSDLLTEATWMQAAEANAARAYWTDYDTSDPVYEGYGHSIAPLNFGAKRDYATWFSPEPAAALAILIIPASPSSDHLVGTPERIKANIEEGTKTKGFDQQYGDYLLMYSALAGEDERKAALEKARTLDDEFVDDGNSRSYLLAFLMSGAS